MVRRFPVRDEALCFTEDESRFETVIGAIRAVRSLRAEMNVPPSKRSPMHIITDDTEIFEGARAYISRLAQADEIEISAVMPSDTEGTVAAVTEGARILLPLRELVNIDKERARIGKELAKAEQDLARTREKLQNEAFVSKAPEAVINTERERLAKAEALVQ